jgi:uncharacterized protein
MIGVSSTGRPLSGIEHLRQSIRDILTTRIGTRVMCRDYGSRLPELIDKPVNTVFTVDVYAATAEALAQWEPRFELTKVSIVEASAGRVVISLKGIYKADASEMLLENVEVL